MSLMMILLILWGVLTTLLVLVLIYRGTLTMHEDDQLFLEDNKSTLQIEQEEVLRKLNKLQPFVWLLSTASGVLILVMAAIFVYRGISQM